MKWVLLFFCSIFIIFLFLIIILVLSTIKLNIKKFHFSNFESGVKKGKIENEILICLELYFINRIKIASFSINKNIFSKIRLKNDFQKLKNNYSKFKNIKLLDILKTSKLQIEKAYLNIKIGTDDVIITGFLVTFISSITGILFRKTKKENLFLKILPLYSCGNAINFDLNCIIKVKMVHIIYVIFILIKKGMNKNERASNRRSYDYSYE